MINPNSLKNLEKRGRTKGARNRFTQIKYQMLSCFDLKEFKEWKKKSYSDFVRCMCSIMPKDLNVDGIGNQVIVTFTIREKEKNEKNIQSQ